MTNYQKLLADSNALLDPNDEIITTYANSTALIKSYLDDISWVGFYIMKENSLYLGPFQGHVACTNIKLGHGVCGESAQTLKVLNVKDVSNIKNYIACSNETKSEIVLPIIKNAKCIAVLDIDSNSSNRFDEIDESYLQKLVEIIQKNNYLF